MKNTIEKFIYEQPVSLKDTLSQLHELMLKNDLERKLKYHISFYYKNSWVCYLNPLKKGGVELCFTRGNEMVDVYEHLDFKDRKQVGVVLNSLKQMLYLSHSFKNYWTVPFLLIQQNHTPTKKSKGHFPTPTYNCLEKYHPLQHSTF